MGENLDVGGRMSVRTPMQWTAGRNGGFSTARPSRLPHADDRGRVRPRARQRRPAAARPGLAAALHAHAHPALPQRARARLGSVRGDRAAGLRGVRAHADRRASPHRRRPQLLAGCPHGAPAGGSARRGTRCGGWRRARHPARSTISPGERCRSSAVPSEVPLDGYGYRWFRVEGAWRSGFPGTRRSRSLGSYRREHGRWQTFAPGMDIAGGAGRRRGAVIGGIRGRCSRSHVPGRGTGRRRCDHRSARSHRRLLPGRADQRGPHHESAREWLVANNGDEVIGDRRGSRRTSPAAPGLHDSWLPAGRRGAWGSRRP